MQKKVKLILTDIDGTILPYGQKQVSERCIAAFHAAMDAGVHVGPASGRGQRQIAPLLRGDETCCATALASNGMEVYLDGQRIRAEVHTSETLGKLAKILRDIPGTGLVAFQGATPYLVEGSMEVLARCFPSYAKKAQVADEIPDWEVVKANVFMEGDVVRMQDFADRLHQAMPQLDFDVPQPSWLNMMTHGWNKGSAVDALCDALGIGLDQVAVFGDGGNDVPMLSHVPLSFAVAGAADAAKAAAHYQIGPCEEDAVAKKIEELLG